MSTIPLPATQTRTIKVLIAEDEPVSRRLLENYLVKWGYAVSAACDGAEAWRMFQQEEFPLVISDWNMPEVDGLELIRRIRAQPRPFFVYAMLLTARSQKEYVVAGMEAGADDFLAKPFDREELRVRLREGERIIGLERSLAEQNRALRDTQAALVQSEKLAGLGHLAAGMAHEINNPIAFVSGNLAVLRRDSQAMLELIDHYQALRAAPPAEQAARLAEIERLEQELDLPFVHGSLGRLFDKSREGLQRVGEIVRNLRDFARLDEAEFNDVDLNAAIASTVEMLRHEAGAKDVQLSTRLQDSPTLQGHPAKLNQLLLNLLLNAIQACDRGGHVAVRTRIEGSHLVLEIEDDGTGISAENLPRIFEPFFTTRPVGQGKGLGLAISYGIVHDHGGTIEVDSQLGRGSTFRVRMPLQATAGA